MPINRSILHFLPSQVRGVYRFDETYKDDLDGEAYRQFVENKLRFLPCSLIGPIQNLIQFNNRIVPCATHSKHAQRWKSFFERHCWYFQNALNGEEKGSDNYLEVQFVKKILAPILTDAGLAAVQPQKKIGPYFADFAIEGPFKLVLEVDGFGKFKCRQDLDKFITRQNYLVSQGWRIIRFTYGQIMESTKSTLRILRDLLAAEPQGSNFLFANKTVANQPRQGNLFHKPDVRKPDVFDIVNGFYRTQDWFGQFVIDNPDSEIHLLDSLSQPLPLVALALSSLYSFLESIEKVVKMDFDLPPVKVCSPSMDQKWQDCILHSAITVCRQNLPTATPVTPQALQQHSHALPTPLRSEERISFRTGLSIDQIQQGLGYITREVFGYQTGTKPFQEKVLQRLFDGKETLGISTTGSGKSFCFWLPALLRPGLSIIIAPLRSLMRDQRLTLLNYGIASMEFINSDIESDQRKRFMEEVKFGYVRLLYVSPERMRIRSFMDELKQLEEIVPLNLLAIDEAHCISEWGHDFRPSYLKLPTVREQFKIANPELRFVALTATAGQLVEQDMRNVLKLTDSDVIRSNMADREKFSYQIIPISSGESKTAAFQRVLKNDLAKALRQQSLDALLKHRNARQDKTVGLVFCVYADPHGKNTIYDGVSHYLFQTMEQLEQDQIFLPQRRKQTFSKYNPEAFTSGKARAFSSKSPTLCPRCHSYAFTSRGKVAVDEDEEGLTEIAEQAENNASKKDEAWKVCMNCGHQFQGGKALPPQNQKNWELLTKKNQIDFKDSALEILVATKGFGMGIDKSSVRFVVHTTLSSGIESWYQEVGRAGRDDERAHIVLLADPPNAACHQKLLDEQLQIKRPQCSWKGCRHGRDTLCDYGKQHIFINSSYPGEKADAFYALNILDKLLRLQQQEENANISLPFRFTDDVSRPELALYRLHTLGLIEDWAIDYRTKPHFEVKPVFDTMPGDVAALRHIKSRMRHSFEILQSHNAKTGKTYEELLDVIRQDYIPDTDFWQEVQRRAREKTPKFLLLSTLDPTSVQVEFFRVVYEHILMMLDHVYKKVVKMRYDMLWNLLAVVKNEKCQRVSILPYFEREGSVDDKYECGCCNVCSPELNFKERVNKREKNKSYETSLLELNELLKDNQLDIVKLRNLCEVFKEYRTDMYNRGRSALQENLDNLPALYITRHFSPLPEVPANTKSLLRTANEQRIPLSQLKELYDSSRSDLLPDLLLILNEQYTTCDSPEGWKFLAKEASLLHYSGNEQIRALQTALEFFTLVDELPPDMKSFKEKSIRIKELLNA